MKVLNLFILIFVFSLGCGGSDSNNPEPDNDNEQTLTLENVPDYQLENTDDLLSDIEANLSGLTIDEFFEDSFKIITQRSHESIIADGRLDEFQIADLNLNNISDEYYFQTVAIKEKLLELLLAIDRATLSASDQLSYDVYESYLNFEIEESQFRDFQYPATYGIFGIPGNTEGFFTRVMQITNKQDADNYLKLLNQIGRRFQQIEDLLDARAAAGVREPSLTFGYSQSVVDSIAQSAANNTSYFNAFVDMVSPLTNITNAEKEELYQLLNLTITDRVLPAYLSLSQKMANMLADAPNEIGFGQFTGGDAFYAYQLRYFTNTNMTAAEVHQLGLDELARIHDEMRTRFLQLGYPASDTITQWYSRLEQEAGYIQGDQAIATYEAIIDDAYAELPNVFAQLPQQEVVVIGGTSGGFYIAGSDDGTRPGAFYAYTAGPTPYTTMPTLAYHEAVPGHHLQIALARELSLPTFRQKTNFTSYVEGWGLYAERLAYDLGWYDDDIYGDLGRLQFEAMRASRLVLDTGIHDLGWSYQQAEAFSQENVGIPGSIARYSVWPGQATAYTVGMLKILELRERAETQLGNLYDIREFHTRIVGSGSMPLPLLEALVDDYIAETLGTP